MSICGYTKKEEERSPMQDINSKSHWATRHLEIDKLKKIYIFDKETQNKDKLQQ